MLSTTNTKTLYTPVFFLSPSEPQRDSGDVPSAYLKALSRTHIALAQIVQEVPSSRPGSPTEDADGSYPDPSTQQRISAIRARVQAAWAMTDGNPADGKWSLLTQLLRMGVTSGKAGRWAGTRADLEAPDAPGGGWINAVTEPEWAEWERRVGLKDKVENWKMRLETHEELVSQVIRGTQVAPPNLQPAPQSAVSNPLKSRSLFGFAVVKRSTGAGSTKPPGKHVDSEPKAVRKIDDIPETSFLPPSFSSQMMTSTPNTKPTSRKPDPIPFTVSPPSPGPGSPLSSSQDGRQEQPLVKSTSLPAIASTPVPTTPTRSHGGNHKRPNEDVEHDRAVKKTRTMPSLDPSSVSPRTPHPLHLNEDGTNSPWPTTPKRQNLPTLTELLASAKKGKKKMHSPKGLIPKSTSTGAADPNINPASNKFRFPSPLPTVGLEDGPYYATTIDELGIDPDLSPTKSLSSLAGSDSEDDQHEDDELKLDFSSTSFNPYATSTQHQNYLHEEPKGPFLSEDGTRAGAPAPSSLGFGGGYNSQFDVAGQVDKVDKLLEKDVDFESWLRDPSLEKEVPVKENP